MKNKLLALTLLAWPGTLVAQNCNLFCNGGFDSLFITTSLSLFNHNQLPCWRTTASDSIVEVWGSGHQGIPSYSGIQFLEMNAYMPSTLYQDIAAIPGKVLSISFAHRGRGGTDSISVTAGPVGGPYALLGVFGDTALNWGYYTVYYTVPNAGNLYSIRFNSVYWGYNIPSVGNLLDPVDVCITTGIPETGALFSSSVHPLPALDRVTLTFDNPDHGLFDLILTDGQGRVVRRLGDIREEYVYIERAGLAAGMYFYSLQSPGKKSMGKMIFAD